MKAFLILGLAVPGFMVQLAAQSSHPVTQPVTFAHDIAPLVYQNCAPGHHPGEAAPFRF